MCKGSAVSAQITTPVRAWSTSPQQITSPGGRHARPTNEACDEELQVSNCKTAIRLYLTLSGSLTRSKCESLEWASANLSQSSLAPRLAAATWLITLKFRSRRKTPASIAICRCALATASRAAMTLSQPVPTMRPVSACTEHHKRSILTTMLECSNARIKQRTKDQDAAPRVAERELC